MKENALDQYGDAPEDKETEALFQQMEQYWNAFRELRAQEGVLRARIAEHRLHSLERTSLLQELEIVQQRAWAAYAEFRQFENANLPWKVAEVERPMDIRTKLK